MYEFKKFARQHKFWEEYKRLSYRLGYRKPDYYNKDLKKVSFIELVEEVEPVTLIQSTSSFCNWPHIKNTNGDYWAVLSKEWAYICLKNGLFYREHQALSFVKNCISMRLHDRYIREKEQGQLELNFK